MTVHVVIVVWGAWHRRMLAEFCLPSLMAPGNLLALAAQRPTVLRVLTVRSDVAAVEALPLLRAAPLPVEVVAISDEPAPGAVLHQQGWLRAAADARAAGAYLAVVHPDTLWSDGAFADLGRRIDNGADLILKVILRAASETLLPELRRRGAGAGRPLALSGREMVSLGLRHLHPYYASLAAGSPHGRLSVEGLWPVPGEGLLMRQSTVEIFAMRPGACEPNTVFCPMRVGALSRVDVVTDSDDMMTLTMTPLLKDAAYYDSFRKPSLVEWASLPLSPLVDSPVNRLMWRTDIRLRYADPTPAPWRRARRLADAQFGRIARLEPFLRLHDALQQAGCRHAARLLACAVQRTPLVRRWRGAAPVAVLALRDAAVERAGLRPRLEALAAPGREAGLLDFIRRHALVDRPPAGTAAAVRPVSGGGPSLLIFDDAAALHHAFPALTPPEGQGGTP